MKIRRISDLGMRIGEGRSLAGKMDGRGIVTGRVRTLESTWGMKSVTMLLNMLERLSSKLPGYVRDTGLLTVRKAASGAGETKLLVCRVCV